MAASAVLPMAGLARRHVEFLGGHHVAACVPGLGLRGFGQSPAPAFRSGHDGIHGSRQREQPDPIAPRGPHEQVSGGIGHDVLLPFVLEHAHRGIHAGTRLELPKASAGRSVERRQPSVVTSDEYQPAPGRDRPTVAPIRPTLTPSQSVRRHVDGREDAGPRRGYAAEDPSPESATGLGLCVEARTAPKHGDLIRGTDVVQSRFNVV